MSRLRNLFPLLPLLLPLALSLGTASVHATTELQFAWPEERADRSEKIAAFQQRVEAAFARHDYTIRWHVMPTNRARRMLHEGRLDGLPVSVPLPSTLQPAVVQVEPAIAQMDLWLYTGPSRDCGELTHLDRMTPGALKGLRFYDLLYSDKTIAPVVIENFNQVAKLLTAGRIDYIFLPHNLPQQNSAEPSLQRCSDRPAHRIYFYTQLHRKHAALLGPLRETYRELFPSPLMN